MHITPTTTIGLALFVIALAFVPDKYKPAWIYRPNRWQMLIGLIAVVAALLIVMNPEFAALGILGDSTFFDLLVLAISLQLQTSLSRIGVYVVAGGAKIIRFINWRICVTSMFVAFTIGDIVSTIQRVAHRLVS